MKIYLIRHGESEANKLNLFLGHGDMDLTELGYEQARRTAKYMKTLSIDAIYSSDLSRAYHTAMETAKLVNLPVKKDKAFREIDCGEWECLPFAEIIVKFKDSFSVWQSNISEARCDGGESVEELMVRILGAVKEIAKNHPNEKVAVFTHATPIRCLVGYSLGKGKCGISEIGWPNNASVTEIECVGDKINVIEYGRDDFLGDIRTGLPTNV